MRNKTADITEFDKPRVYRDRKKDHSKYRDPDSMHPIHRPYEREKIDWAKEVLDEDNDESSE